MATLTYLLKADLVFMVLYGTYHLALRRETWFTARRTWLLASLALAFMLPLLTVVSGPGALPATMLPIITLDPSAQAGNIIDPATWLLGGHLAITVVLVLVLVRDILRADRLLTRGAADAGSFLHRVHVSAAINATDRTAMLAHEDVHARQGHTIDVLVYRLAAALCWSFPLWRHALRELRLVHELIADATARHRHPDYGALLLARALGTSKGTLVNSFRSSDIKQRLTMLYNERSPQLTRRRLLLGIPAILFAMVLISWQVGPPPAHPLPAAKVLAGNEQQASFPGGMDALVKYLSSNLKYPAAAQSAGVQGTVYIAFTVKRDGQVTDVSVKRGVRDDIDAEALRVVKAMPAWEPARSGDKPVDSRMTLPIAFKLEAKP